MQPHSPDSLRSRFRLPALALLSAAALMIFVIQKNDQAAHANTDPTSSSSSCPENFRSETSNPKSEIVTQKSPDTATLIAALLRDWEDLDNPDEREATIAELEKLLQSTDLAELIRTLPADVLNLALGLPSFQTWLTASPETTAPLVAIRPEISEAHARNVLNAWRTKDPALYENYIRTLAPGPWREKAITIACRQIPATRSSEAAALAGLLESSPQKTGLLEQIATTWSAIDPAAATHWAGQIADTPTREHLFAALAVARAGQNPQEAARWLLESVRPGAIRNKAQADIASIWAETEPATIAAWITRFSEGEHRQAAVRSLVNIWANLDRPAATAWIAQMPPGPQRDEAQAHLATIPQPIPAN